MKKLVLGLFALCAILQVNAQEIHFTPKVGMNIANLTKSDAGSRIGLNVGIAGEMLVAPSFAVESGLFYSMQGAKEGDVKLSVDYIKLPILGKYYAYQGLNFFAGPELGFKTNSKIKTMGVSVDTPSGLIKGFDMGLSIGAGYQFDMGLQISASYTYGLIGIMDMDKAREIVGSNGLDLGDNSHNSVFSITAGWRF